MGYRKGVVDVDVTKRSKFFRQHGIVLLFAFVKPRIFEKKNIALVQRGHRRSRFFPDAVIGESYGPVQHAGERLGERCERHVGHDLPLRPAKVR